MPGGGSAALEGPGRFVVAITSVESRVRDRDETFVEHEVAGISEYWLIDLPRGEALFYELDAAGRYRSRSLAAGGAYESRALPSFRLPVDWLWQRPLPPLHAAIRQALG